MPFITTLENYAPSPAFSSSGYSSTSVALPFINSRTQNRDPGRTYSARYRTYDNRYINGINNLCSPSFTRPQPLHVFGPPLSHGASQQYRLEHGDEDEERRETVLIDEISGFPGSSYYDDDDDDENPHSEPTEYADRFIFVVNDLHDPRHPCHDPFYRISRPASPVASSQYEEPMEGYGDSDGEYHNDNDTEVDIYYDAETGIDYDHGDDDDEDTPTVEHIEDVSTLPYYQLD